VPEFFLINKTPGEGRRDNGIVCLEMKLIDWNGKVIENLDTGLLDHNSHSLLYPGLHSSIASRLHRASRLHELSKCIQVEGMSNASPVAGTFALLRCK